MFVKHIQSRCRNWKARRDF
ncbi:MAG: hypothetical protein GC192_14810 [Bacteroidetes bacterium]|nr:hypothetical protein [Bacteroidota bacterium]